MGEEEEKTPYQAYAEETSVGGLKFVLTGSSIPKRITWLMILLACLAGFGYIVRNNFTKIINVPTATTVSSKTEITSNFPAVTICNLNIFSLEVATDVQRELGGIITTSFDLVADLRAVYTSSSTSECNGHFEKYNRPDIAGIKSHRDGTKRALFRNR